MSLPPPIIPTVTPNFVVAANSAVDDPSAGFVDRRQQDGSGAGMERRQFGNSHSDLTEAGRELALAIDQYKVTHHRRYLTCDEMLVVLGQLGYHKEHVK